MRPEPTRKSRFFRPRTLIVLAVTLTVLTGMWYRLPDIAALLRRHGAKTAKELEEEKAQQLDGPDAIRRGERSE